MTDTSTAPSLQSRIHRFMVGDRVAIQHADHDAGLPMYAEGVVTGFGNDERSYITVDFDDPEYPDNYEGEKVQGQTLTLTEDEVRRVA